MLEVAFLCTGNRARSPLAEAFFGRHLEGLPVSVSSYGLLRLGRVPPLPGAVAVAAAHGLDLTAHRARPLEAGILGEADLVIGFEPAHVTAAIELGADPRRSFLLLELPELLEGTATPPDALAPVERARHVIAEMDRRRAAGPALPGSLADPLGGSPQDFAEAARVIDAVTRLLAARLFPPAG